jgi:hypothetical protein
VVEVVSAEPEAAAFDYGLPDDDELQTLALEAATPQLLLVPDDQ